jgi:hypothetical protein
MLHVAVGKPTVMELASCTSKYKRSALSGCVVSARTSPSGRLETVRLSLRESCNVISTMLSHSEPCRQYCADYYSALSLTSFVVNA